MKPAAKPPLKNKTTAPPERSKSRPAGKDKVKGKALVEHMQEHRDKAEPSTVQDLITAGADLNVRGKRRTSALMYMRVGTGVLRS